MRLLQLLLPRKQKRKSSQSKSVKLRKMPLPSRLSKRLKRRLRRKKRPPKQPRRRQNRRPLQLLKPRKSQRRRKQLRELLRRRPLPRKRPSKTKRHVSSRSSKRRPQLRPRPNVKPRLKLKLMLKRQPKIRLALTTKPRKKLPRRRLPLSLQMSARIAPVSLPLPRPNFLPQLQLQQPLLLQLQLPQAPLALKHNKVALNSNLLHHRQRFEILSLLNLLFVSMFTNRIK